MRRKTLTFASGLAVTALLLAACGSEDPAPGSGDSDNGGETATEAGGGDGEEITLTVATFNEFGYEELIQDYMDENPGIIVEHRKAATSNEARDNLNTRLAAGSGLADVEAIEIDWLPELMQYPDLFVDLTDPELEGRWLDWKVAQATTPDGKLLGYGTDIGPQGICYRADLFEAAGLPTDREEVAELLEGDWEHYFDVGREFVANSDAAWYDSAGATYQGIINQVEFAYENEDGSVKPLADNSDIRALYDNLLAASVDDGLSAGLEQWSEDWTNAFQGDNFATTLCPGWFLGVIEGNAAGVEGWDIADVYPGGGGNWGGSFLTVPVQGEHPEEAKALAAWLTAPEQQIRAFESKGTFPSQVEALEASALLDSTNEFFNGAPTGEILANRAAAVEVTPFKGANYFAIHQTVQDAITRVDVSGTDDPDSSWEKALTAFAELGL